MSRAATATQPTGGKATPYQRTRRPSTKPRRTTPKAIPADVVPLVLTVPQVAIKLQCSELKVWRKIANGTLPSIKIDGHRRIIVEELNEYVRSCPRW